MIRIIIADDHQLFIDGIKSILADVPDIEVIGESKNGLELIKAVENQKPEVVLTDIRMPVVDGIAVTKYLSRHFPGLPVLALSMFEEEEEIIDMLKAGAFGYVLKKAGRLELITAIRNLSRKEHYYSPSIAGNVHKWMNDSERNEQKLPLTKREREILKLIVVGKDSQQIANNLKISKYTVDTHRKNIHKKLGIKTNTGLVKYILGNVT